MATVQLNDELISIVLHAQQGRWRGVIDGNTYDVAWRRLAENKLRLRLNGEETAVTLIEHDGTLYLHGYGRSWTAKVVNPLTEAEASGGDSANAAIAPMPGTVVSVAVAAGDAVTKGGLMMTIESMKMLTDINAPRDGVVADVHLGEGDVFDKGSVLITLEE